VRTIDLLPTLLELAGIEVDASVDGRSLLPLMRGEDDADRFAFSEHVDLPSNELRHTSLRLPGAKLIVNHTSSERPPVELYDLRNDPRELRNLADERSEQTSQLHALLKQQRSAIGERRGLDPTGEITDELKKRLESLGYVE
jgi:arylsulfatase A-like enzyme